MASICNSPVSLLKYLRQVQFSLSNFDLTKVSVNFTFISEAQHTIFIHYYFQNERLE